MDLGVDGSEEAMASEGELSAEELLRRVDEAGLRVEFDLQGFVGGQTTNGWATRVVARTGGRFADMVLFHSSESEDRGLEALAGTEARVLARTAFSIRSDLGPIVVSDRVLPASIEDPSEWVSWAVDAVETIEERGIGRQPLPDNEFWELISDLKGEVTEASAEGLSLILADLPEHVPLDFMDAFDRKLFELDAPGNTVGLVSDPGVVDDDASLIYRCEIIARGQATFEQHIRDPRPGTPGKDGLATPEILYVYEDATGGPLPVRLRPISTRTNPELWPDAEPLRPSRMPEAELPSPGPFSQGAQLNSLFGGRTAGHLHGFAAYMIESNHVREVLGCVIARSPDEARAEVTPFLRDFCHAHETLHPSLIVTVQDHGVARGAPLVTLERHSRLSLSDFVARFYLGQHVT